MSDARFSDVRHFEVVDSTNRYLLEAARAGADDGVVAVADYQTAGRGRRGRRWEAPAGTNLLASVLLRPELAPPQWSLVTAAVALAARDAVAAVCDLTLGVKWPNDLVAEDGGKVAGVLAEMDTRAGGEVRSVTPAIVVGIGVNCNWPDKDDDLDAELRGRVASLRQLTGRTVDKDAILAALLDRLAPRVDDLATAEGRGRQRAALCDACTTLGKTVRVETANRVIEGTATDITDDGHLIVTTANGSETVVTGDIVHLRDAGARRLGGGARG